MFKAVFKKTKQDRSCLLQHTKRGTVYKKDIEYLFIQKEEKLLTLLHNI